MKMKHVASFALVAALTLSGVFASASAGERGKLSGKKLRVGTMAMTVGIPAHYADIAGFYKDAGLNVEIVVLATGAPINEAMAAEELDIAVSGMASVFGLATGRYKYIADGMIAREGEAVYARPDSEFAKTKGPKAGVYGSAELVRGADILGPLATSGHLSAIKYAESFGLTAEDFNMVSMDYSQAQQAFMVGQGDLVALTTPWSNLLADAGFFRVSDLGLHQGINLVDAIFVQADMVDKQRADLLAFLGCYYKAAEALNSDVELWKKVGKEWYAEEGKTVTDQQIGYETRQKIYPTLATALVKGNGFGDFMLTMGKFFMGHGMIPEENFANIENSLDDSLLRELKAEKGLK